MIVQHIKKNNLWTKEKLAKNILKIFAKQVLDVLGIGKEEKLRKQPCNEIYWEKHCVIDPRRDGLMG